MNDRNLPYESKTELRIPESISKDPALYRPDQRPKPLHEHQVNIGYERLK